MINSGYGADVYEKDGKRFEERIAEKKSNFNSRYNTENREETIWEMYEDGYAAVCFVRMPGAWGAAISHGYPASLCAKRIF